MASPQIQHGYLKVANELAKRFATLHLSGNQWSIMWVVIFKTYGWNKKQDNISLTQFSKSTGLSRPTVVRNRDKLVRYGVLGSKIDTSGITTYWIIKDYDKWNPSGKIDTSSNFATRGSSKTRKKVVANLLHTKDIITKDTIKNKDLLDSFGEPLRLNINTYLDRVRLSNKSKVITQGRINTLLTELSKTREHFKNDVDFEYALEQAISRDACNIGYITAIMKNRQTQKPKPKIEKNYDSLIESKLNKIATKDMIKDLMREIPENLWWKIKEYLKKRYPAGGKCYPEAEREMMKCLK